MSSLLGLPNSIQQFKCHTTLHMLSVLCVVLVYNFLGKLLHLVIKVSWKFLIAHKQLNLMSSLPGWACQYYSRNLPIPAFPWSACRVHLMSSLLGWACQYYSPNFRHYGKCNIGKMISIKISFTHDVESVWQGLYDVFSAAIYICFVIHTNR